MRQRERAKAGPLVRLETRRAPPAARVRALADALPRRPRLVTAFLRSLADPDTYDLRRNVGLWADSYGPSDSRPGAPWPSPTWVCGSRSRIPPAWSPSSARRLAFWGSGRDLAGPGAPRVRKRAAETPRCVGADVSAWEGALESHHQTTADERGGADGRRLPAAATEKLRRGGGERTGRERSETPALRRHRRAEGQPQPRAETSFGRTHGGRAADPLPFVGGDYRALFPAQRAVPCVGDVSATASRPRSSSPASTASCSAGSPGISRPRILEALDRAAIETSSTRPSSSRSPSSAWTSRRSASTTPRATRQLLLQPTIPQSLPGNGIPGWPRRPRPAAGLASMRPAPDPLHRQALRGVRQDRGDTRRTDSYGNWVSEPRRRRVRTPPQVPGVRPPRSLRGRRQPDDHALRPHRSPRPVGDRLAWTHGPDGDRRRGTRHAGRGGTARDGGSEPRRTNERVFARADPSPRRPPPAARAVSGGLSVV